MNNNNNKNSVLLCSLDRCGVVHLLLRATVRNSNAVSPATKGFSSLVRAGKCFVDFEEVMRENSRRAQ